MSIRRVIKQISLLLLIVSGTACGVVMAFGQSQTVQDSRPSLLQAASDQPPGATRAESSQQSLPKAVVRNATFDFGLVVNDDRHSHEFTLTNEGNATLTLSVGPSTCLCTVAELRHHRLRPGEATKIKVEWSAHEYEGPFEQIATIKTNDPRQKIIELTIKGTAVAPLELVPNELVLGRVLAGRSIVSKVKLLSHIDDKVKILGVECLQPETAAYFQVDYTPLQTGKTAGRGHVEQGFAIAVTVKPGLPQGPFMQTIRFETTASRARTVELCVRGRIGSNIMIAGPGWDKQHDCLHIGMVDANRGAKRTLRLIVHGWRCSDVQFKVAEIWPRGLLHATLGKTVGINKGKVTQTPLEIEIPKGSPSANHLGSQLGRPGRVVLESNYENVAQIVIPVHFAVKGG